MIYYKISLKLLIKIFLKNFYIYIIDILLFFIKQNKKKKFNKNTKKYCKKFLKNIYFFLHVQMFDISLVEGYVFFLIYFYNDLYYKN